MVNITNFVIYFLIKCFPKLELKLKQLNSEEIAEKYIKKSLKIAIVFALIPTVLGFFVFLKEKISLIFLPLVFLLFLALFLFAIMQIPNMTVKKRTWEIESDLIYSTRYLLLQLENGTSLMNALIRTSYVHTNSAKYFGEIVTDIYMGRPLERAIEYFEKYTPSKQFQRILKQINNALRTGVDLKKSLNNTIEEITKQHMIEIKEYGKKLAPMTMFYMIFGTIVPSLGAALFVIAASFMNLQVTLNLLFALTLALAAMQVLFILIFKALKPMAAST